MRDQNRNEVADVLIVGAGPVGLTLACDLARHGIRPRLIDRLNQPLPYCRAIGVTPRSLEVWEDMGIAREMIDAGIWLGATRNIVNGKVDDDVRKPLDLPFAALGIPQYETERVLAEHAGRLGIRIERGLALESLSQSCGQVQTVLASTNGDREEAAFQYVVGCDGARSAVRRALGIAFEGDTLPYEFMLGDVHIDWSLPRAMVLRALRTIPNAPPDLFIAVPLPARGRYRVTMFAPPDLSVTTTGSDHGIQSERPAPGIEHLQAVADRLLPEKATLTDVSWSSIFRISMRLAAHYRRDNVFIAGDAAHIHPPTGGQGMNTGIQDAYNLAWKLALVLKGRAPQTLLDSYEGERRPVGAEVVKRTTAATEQLDRKPASDTLEARLVDTQILLNYRGSAWIENPTPDESSGPGPLAGDRAPDCQGLRRKGFGFPLRMFDLLRGAEHVLLAYCRGTDANAQLAACAQFAMNNDLNGLLRVAAIVDRETKAAELPGLPVYEDAASEFRNVYGSDRLAFLIRPDGYIAWAGQSSDEPGLRRQLERTFLMPH